VYEISAAFENIGGLKERSPVSAGGVRVGKVVNVGYDNEQFTAVVTMQISGSYRFPTDTSASILTAGLLEYLADKGEIELTQSALVLEQVIGQFLFSKAQEEE